MKLGLQYSEPELQVRVGVGKSVTDSVRIGETSSGVVDTG